jgi:hypothetical protein
MNIVIVVFLRNERRAFAVIGPLFSWSLSPFVLQELFMNPLIANIWNHPRTSVVGLLIAVVSVGGVLSQQGISLGHAGTGTAVTLVTAIASALLGLLARDPNPAPGSASASSQIANTVATTQAR